MIVYKNYEYKSAKILLKPNSNIIIYTDGVTEAQNTKEEFYGEDRLLKVLNGKIKEEGNSKEIIENIEKDIKEFSNGATQFDDITILDLKYL